MRNKKFVMKKVAEIIWRATEQIKKENKEVRDLEKAKDNTDDYLKQEDIEDFIAYKQNKLDEIYTLIHFAENIAYEYIDRKNIKKVYFPEEIEGGLRYFVVSGELIVLPEKGCDPWRLPKESLKIAKGYMVNRYHPITTVDIRVLTDLISELFMWISLQ